MEESYEDDFLKSSGLVAESLEKKSEDLRKFNSPMSGGVTSSGKKAVIEQ